MNPIIEVVDYNPAWPQVFGRLKDRIWPVIQDLALSLEHVGSTSVEGLAAKPVIDMDIVIPSMEQLPLAVERLASLGYVHLGNLGIEGRDAFKAPADLPKHNLYVCPQDSLGLRNHLALRDYLRKNPEAVQAYGTLKKQLAKAHPQDIGAYVEGKTDLIVGILREIGLASRELNAIEVGNRRAS